MLYLYRRGGASLLLAGCYIYICYIYICYIYIYIYIAEGARRCC
eukprot:SAG31_NODE_674_length_12909_cov_25.961124_14_plen_44_part_00